MWQIVINVLKIKKWSLTNGEKLKQDGCLLLSKNGK